MADEDLRDIADTASACFESVEALGGTVWWSQRRGGAALETRAFVPGGLHIIAGVSDMAFHSAETGAHKLHGPCLSAMLVPDEGVYLKSRLKAGFSSSFGAHLPARQLSENRLISSALLRALHRGPLIARSGTAARCTAALAMKLENFYCAPARQLLFESRALELVATLTEIIDDDEHRHSTAKQKENAAATRDYIEAHLKDEFLLNDLAKAVGISLRTMTDHFKVVYGEPVGSFIARRRIESAMQSISRGASIAQAAYEHCYQPSAFTHAFKRRYGFAPSKLAHSKS
ncbi:MAG: AraC family transcriptional regulator [Pseudomonadota bacterium]